MWPKTIFTKINRKLTQFNWLFEECKDFRFFIRRTILEDKILHCHEQGVTSERYCDVEIIVSLTTYGRRINDVCFTIESLMQQTRKANRIILWLDEQNRNIALPATLRLQQSRGLEVMYTKDIRSYKKLIPALNTFPDAAIITTDDDIIYDFDILDRLISAYISDPESIHACRIHTMTFDKDGNLMPYDKWAWNSSNNDTPTRNFITGGGGTLYPPHRLAPQVLDESVFSSISPTADDVWFTAMALLCGTKIKKVPTRSLRGEDYIYNPSVQDMGLWHINTGENGNNDRQIKAVFEKYDIYRFIK